MSLFSPWLWLGFLIVLGVTNTYSYVRGQVNKENSIKASQLDTTRKRTKAAIEKANVTRAADVKGEKRAAEAAQAKDLLAMEARHALELDIERRRAAASHSCDLDDQSLGLLHDAIRRANTGDRAPPGGKPDPALPRDPGPGRRERGDAAQVVLRLDPALRRVP